MRNTHTMATIIARLTVALALAFLVVGLLSSAAGAQLPGARPRTTEPTMRADQPPPPETPQPPAAPVARVRGDDDEDDDESWMDAGEAPGLGPCMEQLELSQQQQERIAELRAQAHRDMIRARGDVAKARAEVHAQASDPAAARASIERAAGELQRARAALHDRMLKAHLDVRDVLTADQRKQLSTCRWRAPFGGHRLGMHGALGIGPRMHRRIEREVIRQRAPRGGMRGWGAGWGQGWGRGWF